MEVPDFLALFENCAEEELFKLREVAELPPRRDDASACFALPIAAFNGDR